MPAPALKKIAKNAHKPLKKIEKYWRAAKKEGGDKDNPWAYRMGIVERRAGLSRALSTIETYLDNQIESLSASFNSDPKNRKEAEHVIQQSLYPFTTPEFDKLSKEVIHEMGLAAFTDKAIIEIAKKEIEYEDKHSRKHGKGYYE